MPDSCQPMIDKRVVCTPAGYGVYRNSSPAPAKEFAPTANDFVPSVMRTPGPRARRFVFTGGPRPRPSHVTARYIIIFLRGKPRTRQTTLPDRGRIQLMTDLFRCLMSAGAYGGVSLKENATRGTRRRVKTLADSGERGGLSCHQLVDPGQPLSTV